MNSESNLSIHDKMAPVNIQKEITMWKGWISGRQADTKILENCGIQLGNYTRHGWDRARLDNEALKNLKEHSGRFKWGLVRDNEADWNIYFNL